MRLVELAPLESYDHIRRWLQDAGHRAEVPQRQLKDLEDAVRSMKAAAQIAARVAELAMMAIPFTGLVQLRSTTNLMGERKEGKGLTPSASKAHSGILWNLVSPPAVRLQLLILAALVFVVARTQTPAGEVLRAYSSWLLG
jgi:hypothetical protein